MSKFEVMVEKKKHRRDKSLARGTEIGDEDADFLKADSRMGRSPSVFGEREKICKFLRRMNVHKSADLRLAGCAPNGRMFPVQSVGSSEGIDSYQTASSTFGTSETFLKCKCNGSIKEFCKGSRSVKSKYSKKSLNLKPQLSNDQFVSKVEHLNLVKLDCLEVSRSECLRPTSKRYRSAFCLNNSHRNSKRYELPSFRSLMVGNEHGPKIPLNGLKEGKKRKYKVNYDGKFCSDTIHEFTNCDESSISEMHSLYCESPSSLKSQNGLDDLICFSRSCRTFNVGAESNSCANRSLPRPNINLSAATSPQMPKSFDGTSNAESDLICLESGSGVGSASGNTSEKEDRKLVMLLHQARKEQFRDKNPLETCKETDAKPTVVSPSEDPSSSTSSEALELGSPKVQKASACVPMKSKAGFDTLSKMCARENETIKRNLLSLIRKGKKHKNAAVESSVNGKMSHRQTSNALIDIDGAEEGVLESVFQNKQELASSPGFSGRTFSIIKTPTLRTIPEVNEALDLKDLSLFDSSEESITESNPSWDFRTRSRRRDPFNECFPIMLHASSCLKTKESPHITFEHSLTSPTDVSTTGSSAHPSLLRPKLEFCFSKRRRDMRAAGSDATYTIKSAKTFHFPSHKKTAAENVRSTIYRPSKSVDQKLLQCQSRPTPLDAKDPLNVVQRSNHSLCIGCFSSQDSVLSSSSPLSCIGQFFSNTRSEVAAGRPRAKPNANGMKLARPDQRQGKTNDELQPLIDDIQKLCLTNIMRNTRLIECVQSIPKIFCDKHTNK